VTAIRTPEEAIERYTPVMPPQLWGAIGPFVRDVSCAADSPHSGTEGGRRPIRCGGAACGMDNRAGLAARRREDLPSGDGHRYASRVRVVRRIPVYLTPLATLTTLSRRIIQTAPWEPERGASPHPRPLTPYVWAQAVRLGPAAANGRAEAGLVRSTRARLRGRIARHGCRWMDGMEMGGWMDGCSPMPVRAGLHADWIG
jgi:hypothetical protein